ncbi:hypothetical protein FSP39_022144 [Pinctada imbricata]|uniref:TIR domain-containing protein n=1 Tax=Pinctada imbricata TaxID=66713 RepID=A0AA89C2R7_PINIB|nr:hypothetical protein FSP39_022144 [Pinctada imbricata]
MNPLSNYTASLNLRRVTLYYDDVILSHNDVMQCMHKPNLRRGTQVHVLELELMNCTQTQNGVFDCSDRGFHTLPKFPSWTKFVNLSGNYIESIDSSLSGLQYLSILNLANNRIEDISSDAFSDLVELQILDLSDNRLVFESLQNETFSTARSITQLFIQNNRYDPYPAGALSVLSSLSTLYIDVFDGFQFGEEFLSLRNLSKIEFIPRNKFSLRNKSFSGLSNSPIKYLDLQFSGMLYLPIDPYVLSPIRYLHGININIRLSANIKDALSMMNGLRNMDMEYIRANGNLKTVSVPVILEEEDMLPLLSICVRSLDLSDNDISAFPFQTFFGSRFSSCLQTLDVGDNNINGGNYIPFLQYLFFPNIIRLDFSNMNPVPRCSTLKSNIKTGTIPRLQVSMILPNTLTTINGSCNYMYSTHEPPYITFIFHAPGLTVVDLSETGIRFCDPAWNITYHTDIRELDISGWHCQILNPLFLSTITTLEILTFQRSHLSEGLRSDTKGKFLSGITSLKMVDLSGNGLSYFNNHTFTDQSHSLQSIILDNNDFDHIPYCIFNTINLQTLSLKNNKISKLSKSDMSIVKSYRNIRIELNGNRFDCSCLALDSIKWMMSNVYKIADFDKLRCQDSSMTIKNITDRMRAFELQCVSAFWLKLSATCLVLLLSFGVIVVLLLRYRVALEYFYLRARMFLSRYRPLSESQAYTYDAFLSYSNRDSDWVINVLYSHLTINLNKQVCFHDKDFQVGHWISDEIIRCIDESRKVIFIVTHHFLESEWTTYELEMARMHAFRSERNGLIIIMKDKVPIKSMPNTLKKIWWRVVCLELPHEQSSDSESLFWSKLKHALEN